MDPNQTNYRRGLFRLWVAATALWMVATGMLLRPDRDIKQHIEATRITATINDKTRLTAAVAKAKKAGYSDEEIKKFLSGAPATQERAWEHAEASVMFMIVPPAILLVVGIAFVWALSGFRPRS